MDIPLPQPAEKDIYFWFDKRLYLIKEGDTIPSLLTKTDPSLIDSGQIVGDLTMTDGGLKSANYETGISGWKINEDGSAEFRNLTIGSSLIVTSNLDATAIARLFSDGTAKIDIEAWRATDVTKIDGGKIYANSIVLTGLGASVNAKIFTGEADKTTIEGWKHASDITKIDGGKIYTDSITADKIDVSSLSAINADIGTITAGKITTGALIVGTDVVTAEKRFNYPYTKGAIMYFANDGYTQAGSTRLPAMTQLVVDIGTPNAYVQSTYLAGGATDWDKDFDFNLVCKNTTGADDADAFIGLHLAATTIPTTARHIGFYFDSNVLYASNADGTTQKTTDISAGLTLSNWNSYRFVFDAGTDIKFYVNDVLKATHTTNLPATGTADYPAIHTVAKRVSANGSIYVKHTPTCVIVEL